MSASTNECLFWNILRPVNFSPTGREPHGVGVLRAILPKQQQPRHRVLRLGQDGQGRNVGM